MKIGIIGAAGVRSPLLAYGLAEIDGQIGIEVLSLFDIDGDRLRVMARVAEAMARRRGSRIKIEIAPRVEDAIDGAAFVIASIRSGGIAARIQDEAIPLAHGLVGQETVGAGGFACAMRNLRPMMRYAQMVAERAPGATLVNFTNPVGILSQALLNHTDARVLGVCDTPLETFESIATALDRNPFDLKFDYVGLNHLGWVRAVEDQEGRNLLPDLLRSPDLVRRCYRHELFPQEFIQELGLLPTEYLYFYYFPERAVENARQSGQSRGQAIEGLNARLFAKLAAATDNQLVGIYENYLRERNASYFSVETGEQRDEKRQLYSQFSGYERIAVLVIEALSSRTRRIIPLTVRNNGALPDLGDDDSAELPCAVSSEGAEPLPCAPAPEAVRSLLLNVKEYECLTVNASLLRFYDAALAALTMNPLVRNAKTARQVLDEFIRAHGEAMGLSPQK